MSSPTLGTFIGKAQNTQGQAVPGISIAVLAGQVDTVDVATQPGSPLATIYADPYGNSQIPQQAVNLAGTCATAAGSPNVAWASGNPFSIFLEGQTITINGAQYTVEEVVSPTALVLATNAMGTGAFAYSATIPAEPLTTDGYGNFQFWAAAGYYVLQVYGGTVTAQFVQGLNIAIGAGGGGGSTPLFPVRVATANTNVTSSDATVETNPGGGAINAVFEVAGMQNGQQFTIKQTGAGTTAISCSTGGVTFDGQAT